MPTEGSFQPSTDKTEGKGEIWLMPPPNYGVFFFYVEGGLEMEIPLISQEIQIHLSDLR